MKTIKMTYIAKQIREDEFLKIQKKRDRNYRIALFFTYAFLIVLLGFFAYVSFYLLGGKELGIYSF